MPCPPLTLRSWQRNAADGGRLGERTVYDNRWLRLGLVDVEAPNGERWEYHVVHLGRIAVALIVDDQDRLLMSWRYWFVTEQWGYELLGLSGPEPVDLPTGVLLRFHGVGVEHRTVQRQQEQEERQVSRRGPESSRRRLDTLTVTRETYEQKPHVRRNAQQAKPSLFRVR